MIKSKSSSHQAAHDNNCDGSERCAHAALVRQERAAALRALAGQLAHQMRNPLAAIQAACGSLRAEVQDADHLQRLDLTLQEVDRMLKLVTATVQAVAETPEQPQQFDAVGELRDVIRTISTNQPDERPIILEGDAEIVCRLSRNAFRVTLYSLLDHLADTFKPRPTVVDVRHGQGRVRIFIQARGAPAAGYAEAYAPSTTDQTGAAAAIGLLVAERFARDHGGRLSRASSTAASPELTLDLPCTHV